MLDSYVDRAEDIEKGAHRYPSHYPDHDQAVSRLSEVISAAAHEVAAAPDGHRHAVIFGCMVSFDLAKDSARAPAARTDTLRLLRTGGSLPRALAPVLRLWRTAYGQRAA
jgi:hypothetical protein